MTRAAERAYHRAYRKAHRKQVRAWQAAYRAANRERCNARTAAWVAANPEKVQAKVATDYKARRKKHPLYFVWETMMQRCTNPKATDWNLYGGIGVKVCKRWQTFKNFEADMSPRPKGTSLSRRLDSGNYEPKNVEWGTPADQAAERKGKKAMLALHTYHRRKS
jgi:hypothetical protein